MKQADDFLIYVVDDDAAVLRSLALLLQSHGFAVEPAASAAAFLERFDPERRACLLLDLRMPGMDGAELQRRLVDEGHRLPIIILTGHGDVPAAVRAMKQGAIDFIEKPVDEAHLLAAIGEARAVLTNRPRRSVSREVVAERLARLTAREREVLDHLVLGRLNKEIAEALGISQRTVEIHRARIREKMEARGISDLIMMLS
jgi:two-component system, LuxR family, response regulator FixJ